jgi:site-specific DNA-cytosine methylase
MNAKEITNEPTTPEEQHQADIDNAYSEGHDADEADKHDIQIQQEDQMKTLAAALGISEQQLSAMSDEELESLTGQDDKLDQAIYDYQLSSARYQGVVDDAQDKVDLAAHQAEQRVDMYTDQSRGSVRNATIKASGGLEDYGVYIISGNIATHDDGSIDVSNSDDMILYYDPTTNSVEHADAVMFAELGEELPADDVKAQAVSDAKENAIKEVAGIIDGTVEVGSQFNVTDTDGTEHTYEVLADYGDGTAAISIDGNVVENPYSLADLQQMKDLEDQKRLEAAKAEREQMEKERAAQQTQNTEETQPSFDFNQILNDNGNVVLVDVLGKDGNTKYPNSRLFLIRDTGAKAKVVELKSDGTIVPHAVNKEDVATISSMSLDEYKQAMPESSMIEDNSGENRGEIEVETPTIEGEIAAPAEETAAPESAETPATEQTPAAPAITLEDGTIVPMLEDGNPDFSKLTAAQTAELYDNQFGEDADSIVSGYVSDAKKALDKASNMTVKGKTFVEQKAAKDAKEKAIADAKAAYDSAIAIRDAYNERQLAKVEDTAEGRKELIEKARRKFARLKSAVKDDAEAVSQLYRDTIGYLLHRLYDGTGIDVTDTIPLTAEEYVASNLGAHSLNYEGTETSKGVKQETGLSREDFAKTQLLAADGKGTTIDALVHSLWENLPSNLESLDTQDIRNALIGVLNSGFKASEARNFVENIRIAQAENILEEQKRAQENAAYAEQPEAESEAELKAKSDEKAELKAKSEAKLDNESDNESNDLSNETDNEQKNDNINDNINVPEDATDEAPLGAERDESDLPFSAKENGKQQTTAERAADVEKNKVDDMKVVDNIVGQKTRKAFERLAKMMGANIQWQYSDKFGNGWIQETTDADGNVHRTIFITLDSSITEGAQFIFGHEMTHQIKNLNPAAYNELTQLVLDTYGSDAFDKAVDETMQRYSDAGFSGRARDYYAEEVVADAVGEMIRDLNLAHTLAMKMSHPLLAAIHEILQKIRLAFFGTEYSDVTKNIIRSIEQAYVKTANGEVTNTETGEDVSFSLRQKPEPKKKGIGYKVFVLKDGKLYPPMVANPDGAATPVGVWLDADAAPIAGESKTGRLQVKKGGKGTQGGSGKLAYRPGWHLGVVPYAIQFNRKDAEGNKTLFPKNFVFAEVEYAADVDYQEEARQEGINPSGKYQHSLVGLKHLPTDGYYMYRTNPNPETDHWVITGAMKVNRILTRAEQAELVKNAGREPQQIQEGDIVTDDVVNSINQEIADAPKFSLKVYHGSGADFTEFDFDHMGEGAGSQVFGWGGYVTSSEEIGKSYVELTRKKPTYVYNGKEMSDDDLRSVLLDKVGIDNANILDDFLYNLEKYGVSEAKSILRKGDYAYFKDLLKGTYGSIRSGYQNKVDAAELILAPRNIRVKKYKGNLYEVDIPDDNGNNYLDWDAPITDELIDKVAKALPSLRSYDIKDLKKDRTFDNFYKTISMRSVKDDAAFNDDKAASKLLASLGYTGIKYKAGRNFGGAEEGDTNYVIFKPEDMKITEHTKFSLKTYHGTGANFDRFDTSHAYEGAGSETFGHGIYVTKSAKIGASYALKAKVKKIKTPKAFKAIKNGDNWFGRFIDNAVRSSFAKAKKETFNRMDELIKEDENIVNGETKPEWKQNAAQKELADFDKLKSLFEGLTEEDIPSLKRAKANRYEVEIPDDTGNNYLDWNKPMKKEQKKIVREGLEKLGVDVDRLVRNGYSLDKNFGDVYNGLLYYALNGTKFEERDSFVASSNFLSSLGFTGIKYYAGTIWGGAKKGDLNYVIFNEDDAKIVGNTKFSLKKVNDAFNQRLDELVKNPNQKDKILRLGRSSSFLKAGGIADADIELEFDKFVRKSGDKYKNNHPFNASDLKNLPMAIAEPIAVFKGTNANDHVVLTELQKDGKNFIVAIRAVEQHRKGGVVLEVNQITSLYPKEEKGIINWVNTGRISNVDKEKALHFIEALQPHAGTSITDEELKSAANIINSFETTKENGEKVDSDGTKFSLKDEEYLKAVEDGNMEKAQKMVNEAADAAGYSTDSSYQGTSAFNGAAPWGNGYFLTKDERKEAWDNGEFEGESTLGDYINDDIDGGNLEELTNAASYRAADPMRKDAIDNVRNAIQKKANTITMYRSVPSDVKEGSFRNGDWVTPSRAYAVDNAKLHGWGDDYNIIEQKVPVDDVWFDGNDIAEWGYGREEDYINDTDFAYKNSKNNKKLLDAVTYDDNGNVIPLSQRFNEKNKDVRFSLKDEKTMFGMHNISLDKLRRAIKQGGFAAPSMGVIDSKNGIYSDYGEITLIPKAEKLAKRTGKNAGTFTADAWTPTYPQVERIMNKQGEKAFNTDMNVKLGDVDNGIYSNVRESWKGYLSSGDVRDGLYWHYLFDNGMNPETIYQTGKYDNDITNEVMRISDNGNKTDYTDKEVAELIQLMNKATGKDNDVDAQREKLKARIASAEKQGNHLLVALKKKRLEELEGVENFYIAADFVNDVVRNNRKNGKVDVHDTMGTAKKKVEDNKKLSDDFPSWLDKKTEEYGVEEMLYNGTTPSGKPKYIPNTIENAVKLMKKQGVAGGYTAFGSELGVFIAKNSPEVNTLAAMKNAKDKLIPFGDERHNQIKDKITKEFLELSDEIRVGSNNRYAFDDSGVSRMVELTDHKGNEKEYLKKAYNIEVSDEWMDRYNKLLDTIKKDYKVFYFETKFMRPYGLDEFEKAIVPSDTPSDVIDALKKTGIDVSSYERGNAEDRQKVTMDAINSSDNIRFSLKSMMEKPEGWKQANKKAIHIAEVIERDPKFSLKNLDGTLIKAGTYFSGGGLVEEGLKGIIDPVVAVEYDEKISGVYRNNFGQHIVTADVRDVDPKELVKQIDGEVEYFHASPVCKNYSQAKSNHAEVELDKETAASTAEFINAIKPKVVTIENVKGYKDSEAMKTITDALDANGYTWDADVYNAADYGGYTNRERLIVRAVRDGKLPEKPKKMARKSGWYEAVADIIPTLTEKKNGVAPWMDIRLKADGIDWRNIDKPLYVMGSAYADGKVPHAFADELLPTLRTKSGDVIVMPDGKVYRAMGRVLARVSGVSDDYKMPFSENLSHTIIGNGIPTQLTEHVIAPLLQNTLRPTTPEDGNIKFSLRYDQFEHDLNQWKKDNNLPKDAQRPTIPQRNAGESAVDFLRRVDEYRKQMALWKTAPTYEQHLLSDDTALGEFNRELQRGSVLKRIALQDSMLAIRKAQEAIMKEVGVDRLNMAEDAYTAENRSHGKGKNEFEEYNNEFLQPLRKAYHQMKKILGDSYDNVRIYMMAKHGLERDAQMAFKKSLEADYEDVAQRSAAYKAYKGDMNRIINDSDLEFGRVDFTTWRQRDNALRVKYSPSYMDYRYDKNGIAYDYSGLSALFDGSDFEEAAYKLVKDIEDKYVTETHNLWDATNAATKKILRDGYKAGMMSKDTYQYVRDMYSHYIPLRGWDGTTADQVWDYIGGGNGAFNQTLKKAHGRTSIADDPIAYIENMAESGILLNNKNWVKQHLMLLAQNHPTSLLTLSKAWYVKSTDANGNEEWIPATPQITSQMNSNQVKAAIDAFEKKMEQMAQTGDATQKRDGLNIAYPQTHSEEREHEVRVMKDGEEYVIYVNGDPQLAQAMNNTRAHRVSEGIKNSISKRVIAVVGRKMAAAYTSLSPLFIPSNYFRDLTMTLASTAIREDAKYNYLLRKNLATSWNLGFMLRDFQNGKLRDKVNNGNATPKEQMFYDFMMNGGETGFVSSLDVEDLKKKFKNDLKDLDRWKANPVKVGHTIMDSIEFLNRMIEDSNRFAVYMTSIQYGRSIDEAVNDAKDVTLNFNRKGTGEHSWQTIRNLYLFINPAVQSLQTLGALAKHHPFKFTAVTASWLASGVLVPIVNVALMQLGAAFLGGDGDDDKDWYKDISKKYWQFSKWDRRNNFIMWVPTTHEFVKIPLAQEFRAFYGLGDMIASKMMGGELAEESWEDYGWDLVGQVVDMLPLDPTGYDGNIAVSLMPNAIRPVFELAFNVDFTGKPLFKDTEYNKYDPNFTKAYVGTPDWLVRASRMMNSIGNDYPNVQQNKWDAFGDPRYNLNNPAVVDHVLSSYLGGAYTMGSQVIGLLTKSLNDPKEIKVADIPLFSKFVSNPDDRPVTKKQGDEFWNMKENHDRAANTLSKLKKQAKVDGDYSMLERFYGSEEYKKYKQDDVKVKKYEEDKKKERADESGEEYRPHKLNAEDIYKAHATPKDDFEDLKLKQLYTKLNGFKTSYDLLVDTAPSQSDGYYNNNKAAIDAIDEISLDKQEISELKKGFLDDGKDAYNAEDMKQIRDLRKKILSVLEKANKVVVANQKAKDKK